MPSTSSQKSTSSIEDHAGAPVSKVQIAGEGGEYVIINNQKYYRHDLMAAFGGTLNPGATPWPTVKVNPAPLGLSGFALTTFVLSLYNCQAKSITIPNVVLSLACFYGGLCQFLAGLWEFAAGNTFGMTALCSYGAFWLSYVAILVPNFGIGAAYEGTEQLHNAVGIFLLAWGLFTFMLFTLTLRSTLSFSALFGFLTVTFFLLSAGDLTGNVKVTKAGGVFGVITAFIAWYNAFAGTATSSNSYFTAYSIPLPLF
ncbi:Protein FUN34, partial [Candida maltosa Xu316]